MELKVEIAFFDGDLYDLREFAEGKDLDDGAPGPRAMTEGSVVLRCLAGVLRDMTREQPHLRPAIPELLVRLLPSPKQVASLAVVPAQREGENPSATSKRIPPLLPLASESAVV